jgi:hypothetical protein
MGEHSTRGSRVISSSHQVFNFFAMKINSAIQLTAYERKQLQLVKEYVDAHLHEALDPGELVLSFDISVYKFKAGFVQLCGKVFRSTSNRNAWTRRWSCFATAIRSIIKLPWSVDIKTRRHL